MQGPQAAYASQNKLHAPYVLDMSRQQPRDGTETIDLRLREYGVFRLEGETMRQAVKRANAASASDLTTLTDAVNAFERTYYAKT